MLGFRNRCICCGRVFAYSYLEKMRGQPGWMCIHCMGHDVMPEIASTMLVRRTTCAICNKPTSSTGNFCYWCMKKAHPPTLMLMTNMQGLYNPNTDNIEQYMDIKDFELCGWLVREVKESLDSDSRIFFLEYYGKRRCDRVRNYPYFTKDQQQCVVPSCTQINPLSMVGMMGF